MMLHSDSLGVFCGLNYRLDFIFVLLQEDYFYLTILELLRCLLNSAVGFDLGLIELITCAT